MAKPFIVKDISSLYTNAGCVERGCQQLDERSLGCVKDAWLAVGADGRVEAYGDGSAPGQGGYLTISAQGGMVMPGLVDSHTHPIFGGSRAGEFAARLSGASYQEIAASGGGIRASIHGTRAATDHELEDQARKFFEKSLRWGVTTVEAKSGYGQSVEEELRLLQILNQVAGKLPQHVAITCLALHAVPDEFGSAVQWAEHCAERLLPTVSSSRLATFVDMFIENGYFSVEDCREFVRRAKELGLSIKVHADEFSDSNAGAAAAAWKAVSADHLQSCPVSALEGMAAAGVVATVLPGTSMYTGIPFADARKMRESGCVVAIASDFNPGSCRLLNLPLLATMAGLHCGLDVTELVCGVTACGARALALDDRKGALCPGYDADFLVHSARGIDEWVADAGQTLPDSVWSGGQCVVGEGGQPI